MANRPRVFISYRHSDSLAITGRIHDRLSEALGARNVFKDMEDIPAGSDFRQVLNAHLIDCPVILVIIGRTWASVTDAAGKRRLDNPDDFVRIEVETALAQANKIVIPVLVDNATLPTADELPASLRDLPYRNAVNLRNDPDFSHDFETLLAQLKPHLRMPQAARRRVMPIALVMIAFLIMVIGALLIVPKLGAAGGTNISGGTSLAASTAIPTIEPVATDQYMVLVAQPEALRSPPPRDVARFVIDDLNRNLVKKVTFSKIRIRAYNTVITSEEGADAVAQASGATLIVWGNYTANDVTLNVQMGSLGHFNHVRPDDPALKRLVNVRVQMTDERQQSLAQTVLLDLSMLQLADGDVYGAIRNQALEGLIKVEAATILDDSLATNLVKAFQLVTNDSNAALAASSEAIKLSDNGNPLLFLVRSFIELHRADSSAASGDIQSAARLGPKDWLPPVYMRAMVTFNQSDWASALPLFTPVIAARPDDWFPIYMRGLCAYLAGDYGAAATDITSAIKLQPIDDFPYLFQMIIDLRSGQFTAGRAIYTQTLRDFPDVAFGSRVIEAGTDANTMKAFKALFDGFGELLLGQYSALLKTTTDAIQVGIERPEIYFSRGLAQCGLGHYAEAIDDYTKALALDSQNAFVYALRADSRLRLDPLKNLTAALSDASTAKRLSSDPNFDNFFKAEMSGALTRKNYFDFEMPLATQAATAQP